MFVILGYHQDDTQMSSIRVKAFRGQHGSHQCQTRLASLSFVDSPAVAAFYATSPNDKTNPFLDLTPTLMACELVISNPLTADPSDPFVDFSVLREKLGEDVARQIMLRHSDYVVQTSYWEENFSGIYEDVQALVAQDAKQLEQLYIQIWPLLDDQDTVQQLKQAGIDGAVYRGSGMSMNAVEYRVFDVEQLHNIEVYTNVPSQDHQDVLEGNPLDWSGLVKLNKVRSPRP